MERIIMHIDVNNAFLSWTAVYLLNNGSKYDIRNSYAVIGGDEEARKGIVLAKSIPCKKLGIKTAETLYSARKKCPALRVFKADYLLYKKMSKSLFEYIKNYSPDIEIISIDECFLDYTKVRNLYGDPIEFAHKLKNEIKEQLGFTVNVGIANNKLCAKMASDFQKPDKVHTLFTEEVHDKMWPLDVGKLYGVGKRSTEKLKKLNINTIYDLAHANPNDLYKYFKNSTYKFIESANGINNEEVLIKKAETKGISNSITLEKDYTKIEDINKVLLIITDNVVRSLHKEGKHANVVVVLIKDTFFKSSSHQIKLKNAVNTSKEIYEISKKLFKELWNGEPIRLIGIRLDNLTTINNYQVSLFEDVKVVKKEEELENAVMDLKNKYGINIIRKGSFIKK